LIRSVEGEEEEEKEEKKERERERERERHTIMASFDSIKRGASGRGPLSMAFEAVLGLFPVFFSSCRS